VYCVCRNSDEAVMELAAVVAATLRLLPATRRNLWLAGVKITLGRRFAVYDRVDAIYTNVN